LKKNKSLKKLQLNRISSNNTSFLTTFHFSGCEITDEGLKTISSFLSHDGIVLEQLNLSGNSGISLTTIHVFYSYHSHNLSWLE